VLLNELSVKGCGKNASKLTEPVLFCPHSLVRKGFGKGSRCLPPGSIVRLFRAERVSNRGVVFLLTAVLFLFASHPAGEVFGE
jgi:hypothetical protein